MKVTLVIALAVAVACGETVSERQEFAAGLRYYEMADFGKAAARFVLSCNRDASAKACYWTGLSYERLADTRIPFGCRTAAKAHNFFARAAELAPGQPAYRDALFNFLLDNADCSRAGLQEAARILSAMPASDPEYDLMRIRLAETARWSGSLEAKLSNIFLALPRATHRISAMAGEVLTERPAGTTIDRKSAGASFR